MLGLGSNLIQISSRIPYGIMGPLSQKASENLQALAPALFNRAIAWDKNLSALNFSGFLNLSKSTASSRVRDFLETSRNALPSQSTFANAAFLTVSAAMLSGCDASAANLSMWAMLGVSLLGNVFWHHHLIKSLKLVPSYFRSQFSTDTVFLTNYIMPIAMSFCAFFSLATNTEEAIAVQFLSLGMLYLMHAFNLRFALQAKQLPQDVQNGIAGVEFDLNNANDPSKQIEILKDAIQTKQGYFFHTETYKQPHKLSAIMTGENGILHSEAFADLSVTDKISILEFYQERTMHSVDPEILRAYLKTLETLFLNDPQLERKGGSLIQSLARYRVTLGDPDSRSIWRGVDPVSRLLVLMTIYKALFGMYHRGIPVVIAKLNKHSPDLALLFESNKSDPNGESKLLELLENQIQSQVQENEGLSAQKMSMELAASQADFTRLFRDELPRYSETERGEIIAGALRLICGYRDAKRLNDFMFECEIHLTKKFWKEQGEASKRVLIERSESGVEVWDKAMADALRQVLSWKDESKVSEKESGEDKNVDAKKRALKARLAAIKNGS